MFVNWAPTPQSRSDRLKIMGTHAAVPRAVGRRRARGFRSSLELQACAPVPFVERRVQGITGAGDARDPRQTFIQLPVQRRKSIGGVTIECRVEADDDHLIARETKWLLFQVAQGC